MISEQMFARHSHGNQGLIEPHSLTPQQKGLFWPHPDLTTPLNKRHGHLSGLPCFYTTCHVCLICATVEGRTCKKKALILMFYDCNRTQTKDVI